MKKKITGCLIAAALLALIIWLADSSGIGKKQIPETETNSEVKKTYQIVMQWPGLGDKPDGIENVESAVNEITEKELGVSLKLEYIKSADLKFRTNLDLESGNKLDLCVSIGGGMSRLANAGYLLELDSLLDQYGNELKDTCGIQMTGGYYQGHLYGIPVVYTDGYQYGFICRSDLLEKYRFVPEENHYYTMDELEKLFLRVKEGEGENFFIFTGNMAQTGNIIFGSQYLIDSLGATTASGVLMLERDMDTDVIEDIYETDEYREYAERMYRWRQAGFFMPDSEILNTDPNVSLANGEAFGRFFYNVPGDEVDNSVSSGMEVSFIPTREACRMTESYQTVLWSIPANCENPQKVMEFLNLLYTDETLVNLLQRGIEGSSYVVSEENETGKVISLPEGETIDTIPYYTVYGIYGNRLQVYPWAPADIDQNRKIREFSENIRLESPALGYVFDSECVAVELSAVEEVIAKYSGIINTGLIDPDIELPLFIDELKRAGIDKVIAENQKQYDLWRQEYAG